MLVHSIKKYLKMLNIIKIKIMKKLVEYIFFHDFI